MSYKIGDIVLTKYCSLLIIRDIKYINKKQEVFILDVLNNEENEWHLKRSWLKQNCKKIKVENALELLFEKAEIHDYMDIVSKLNKEYWGKCGQLYRQR